MTAFIQRQRGSRFPVFYFNFLCVLLAAWGTAAAPRPLSPPWPAFGRIYHEGFDQPLQFSAKQTIDPAVWAESFSGYALQRSGKRVTPWVVPMTVSNVFRVEPEQGAVRVWYRPDYGSGKGSGTVATLLELATSTGKASEVWWTLVVSPTGDEVHLVCQTEKGTESCLQAPVKWEAGSWHLLTLGFTPTNSALYIDDQLAAVGDGLLTIPKAAAPYTSLIIGSTAFGALPAQGQMEDLSVFSGRQRMARIMGNAYGLDEAWEIGFYYTSLSKTAALGPISEAEIAARLERQAQRKAALAAQALTTASDGAMQMLMVVGNTVSCVTNSPLYITNTVAAFASNTGWTVTFDIQGTNGPADVFATTNLLGNHITNSYWVWLERGPSCATYQYTNQMAGQSFYVLGSPLDADGDDLTDASELLVSHTHPNHPDSDGDGLSDGWEIAHRSDPFTPDPAVSFVAEPKSISNIP